MSSTMAVGSEEGNNRKPKDSAFIRQELPAWPQPILTAGNVLPTVFAIGVAFIPIGVGLLYVSNQVHEVTVDYTNCTSEEHSKIMCSDIIHDQGNWHWVNGKPPDCECRVGIEKEQIGTEYWEGPVFLYYGLTNFYQNHGKGKNGYVKSRDDNQLAGELGEEPAEACAPFRYISINNDTHKYAPCGAIANSLFNDTIELEWRESESGTWRTVPVLRTGIAWDTDRKYKFRNP